MAKIKITGDVSEIKKSILDLSRDVKDLGKSKVAIFDKEQKDFLAGEAKSHMSELRKEMEKNKKEIQDALKVQKDQVKTVEDEVKHREKVTKLIQRQVSMQKELSKMEGAGAQMGLPGVGRRGMLGRIGGRMGGGMRGMGMLGGLARMAGPLGLLAGAGGFLMSRGTGAANVFREGIQDRIGLRGRGVGDMDLEDPERASRAGLNAQTMRRARLASMDVFGRAGSTQSAVLQRAEVERNFGIEQGTLTGVGQQLRGQFGGEEANKQVMTIQASLIASGITDEIGPYLETAASMLTSLNENGFTFTDSAMAVLNNLTANGGMSAERAGRMVTGVDQAIRGSSGESNAFFQEVFSGAGIGGQTVGGLQAAIRSGGLFGADLSQNYLSDTDRSAFSELGIGGRTGQRVAASTMNRLDTMFGGDEEIDSLLQSDNASERQAGATRRLQRNNFIMNTFGLDNEVQAGEVNNLLREMADPNTSKKRQADIRKKVQEMSDGNSELGNLKLINKSTAGTWDAVKNLHETTRDVLGSKVAPAMISIDKTMMKLDAALSAMLDFFGIETPQEAMKEAISGTDVVNQDKFDQLTMGDKKKQQEFSKEMAGEFSKNQARIAQLKEQGADQDYRLSREGYQIPGEKMREMQELERKNKNIIDSERNTQGLNIIRGFGKDKDARKEFVNQSQEELRKEMAYNQTIPGQISNFFKSMFSDDDQYKPAKKSQSSGSDKANATQMAELINVSKQNVQANKDIARGQSKIGAAPAKGDKM